MAESKQQEAATLENTRDGIDQIAGAALERNLKVKEVLTAAIDRMRDTQTKAVPGAVGITGALIAFANEIKPPQKLSAWEGAENVLPGSILATALKTKVDAFPTDPALKLAEWNKLIDEILESAKTITRTKSQIPPGGCENPQRLKNLDEEITSLHKELNTCAKELRDKLKKITPEAHTIMDKTSTFASKFLNAVLPKEKTTTKPASPTTTGIDTTEIKREKVDDTPETAVTPLSLTDAMRKLYNQESSFGKELDTLIKLASDKTTEMDEMSKNFQAYIASDIDDPTSPDIPDEKNTNLALEKIGTDIATQKTRLERFLAKLNPSGDEQTSDDKVSNRKDWSELHDFYSKAHSNLDSENLANEQKMRPLLQQWETVKEKKIAKTKHLLKHDNIQDALTALQRAVFHAKPIDELLNTLYDAMALRPENQNLAAAADEINKLITQQNFRRLGQLRLLGTDSPRNFLLALQPYQTEFPKYDRIVDTTLELAKNVSTRPSRFYPAEGRKWKRERHAEVERIAAALDMPTGEGIKHEPQQVYDVTLALIRSGPQFPALFSSSVLERLFERKLLERNTLNPEEMPNDMTLRRLFQDAIKNVTRSWYRQWYRQSWLKEFIDWLSSSSKEKKSQAATETLSESKGEPLLPTQSQEKMPAITHLLKTLLEEPNTWQRLKKRKWRAALKEEFQAFCTTLGINGDSTAETVYMHLITRYIPEDEFESFMAAFNTHKTSKGISPELTLEETFTLIYNAIHRSPFERFTRSVSSFFGGDKGEDLESGSNSSSASTAVTASTASGGTYNLLSTEAGITLVPGPPKLAEAAEEKVADPTPKAAVNLDPAAAEALAVVLAEEERQAAREAEEAAEVGRKAEEKEREAQTLEEDLQSQAVVAIMEAQEKSGSLFSIGNESDEEEEEGVNDESPSSNG